MTLLEVEELTRYWVDHPPVHLMVAAYLGLGKGHAERQESPGHRGAAPPPMKANGNVGALLAELGPGFACRDVHAGLTPVVLDVVELRRAAKLTG